MLRISIQKFPNPRKVNGPKKKKEKETKYTLAFHAEGKNRYLDTLYGVIDSGNRVLCRVRWYTFALMGPCPKTEQNYSHFYDLMLLEHYSALRHLYWRSLKLVI